jgi:hypothetical protein
MRNLVLAALAFGSLTMAAPTPAAALFDNYNYPYCITGGPNYAGNITECSYPTYAACQATVAGLGAYCIRNPFFNNPGPYDTPPPGYRRHRSYSY